MTNLIEKINASMVLGSYLDTLGFFNGKWEFNFNANIKNLRDAVVVNYEIVHTFFAMGAFNIDISTWNASDDTIMMIGTMRACKKGGKIKDFIDCYLDILPLLEEKKRESGITTLKSLHILEKDRDIEKIPYHSTMGGNGAAMRTNYIGIYFRDNINKIIEISILSSRLTHNYPMGFLGGMVTALFTKYALDNIEPWKWCDMMLMLHENKTIENIIKKMSIYKRYMKDKDEFWNIWYKYKEYRLNKFDIKTQQFIYGLERFTDLINILYNKIDSEKIAFDRVGGSGASATIIAYDSILMSIINKKNGELTLNLNDKDSYYYNWQSVVFHSTLHFGDNDTIGAITGCWFGALNGYDGIDKKILNQLEFIKDLI